MATVTGRRTVKGVHLISVDADPSLSAGTVAPLGSIATMDTGAGVFRKSGAGATAWTNITGAGGSGNVNATQGDVTGTRAFATVYQNTSGTTMVVQISVSGTGIEQVFVGATTPPTVVNAQTETSGQATMTVVVPPGYYYRLVQFSGSSTMFAWIETQLIAGDGSGTSAVQGADLGPSGANTRSIGAHPTISPVYQNTSSTVMFVAASVVQTSTGTLYGYVGTSATLTAANEVNVVGISAGLSATLDLLVPPGSYYAFADSATNTLYKWRETLLSSGVGMGGAAVAASQVIVTGSRTAGTVYQNTTGTTLHVAVSAGMTSSGTVEVKCDAANPPTTVIEYGSAATSEDNVVVFVVPPGYYYKVSFVFGGAGAFDAFTETALFSGGPTTSTPSRPRPTRQPRPITRSWSTPRRQRRL